MEELPFSDLDPDILGVPEDEASESVLSEDPEFIQHAWGIGHRDEPYIPAFPSTMLDQATLPEAMLLLQPPSDSGEPFNDTNDIGRSIGLPRSMKNGNSQYAVGVRDKIHRTRSEIGELARYVKGLYHEVNKLKGNLIQVELDVNELGIRPLLDASSFKIPSAVTTQQSAGVARRSSAVRRTAAKRRVPVSTKRSIGKKSSVWSV